MRNPCTKTCPDRTPGCRSNCQKRQAFIASLEPYRKAEQRRKLLDGYTVDAVESSKHARDRKTKWRR